MPTIIGIDLGSASSVVAAMKGAQPAVLPNAEGQRSTPSIVVVTEQCEWLIGQAAMRQATLNPGNAFFSIGRLIGRGYDEIEAERQLMPFKIARGPRDDARVAVLRTGKEYAPQEIAAMLLQKLKADAEAALGESVAQAVIAVPAAFNESQRRATIDAATIAGLEVPRLVNGPTAAALAYSFGKNKDRTILVLGLGGGAYDVSVLEIRGGGVAVRSTSGDGHLGGDDYDQKVVGWLIDEFRKDHGIDLRQDRQALQRFKEAAEKAKIKLSGVSETMIDLPFITTNTASPKHLRIRLTRSKLEQLTTGLTERLRGPFQQALKGAGLSPGQLDEVLLVGGATRMPVVQELIRRLTGKEPSKGVNPDEAVALGAAIQAGLLAGEVEEAAALDLTPLALRVETPDGATVRLIERNASLPAASRAIFSTAADGQTALDLQVLQGEREPARESVALGRFRIEDIPAAAAGAAQIEVTFDMDASGILSVSARDLSTGQPQPITITAGAGWSRDELDRMLRDAEARVAEGKRRPAAPPLEAELKPFTLRELGLTDEEIAAYARKWDLSHVQLREHGLTDEEIARLGLGARPATEAAPLRAPPADAPAAGQPRIAAARESAAPPAQDGVAGGASRRPAGQKPLLDLAGQPHDQPTRDEASIFTRIKHQQALQPERYAPPPLPPAAISVGEHLGFFSIDDVSLRDDDLAATGPEAQARPATPEIETILEGLASGQIRPYSLSELGLSDEEIASLRLDRPAAQTHSAPRPPARRGRAGGQVQRFELADLELPDDQATILRLEGAGLRSGDEIRLRLTEEELDRFERENFAILQGLAVPPAPAAAPPGTIEPLAASDDPVIERLIALGRRQGYVDISDIIANVASPETEIDRIEEIGQRLHEAQIEIRDGDEVIDMEDDYEDDEQDEADEEPALAAREFPPSPWSSSPARDLDLAAEEPAPPDRDSSEEGLAALSLGEVAPQRQAIEPPPEALAPLSAIDNPYAAPASGPAQPQPPAELDRSAEERVVQALAGELGAQLNLATPALARALRQAIDAARAQPPARLFGQASQRAQRWALVQAAAQHRRHPARRTILFLRELACARIRRIVSPDRLGELTGETFERSICDSGSAIWRGRVVTGMAGGGPAGDALTFADTGAAAPMSCAEWRRHYHERAASDGEPPLGAEIHQGNLTWPEHAGPLDGRRPERDDIEQLIYCGGDTFAQFHALTSSPRRQQAGLNERIASLLLHAVYPDQYVPYHADLAGAALEQLRLADNHPYRDGFRGYCALACDLLADPDLGFESLADVGYFLQRLAERRHDLGPADEPLPDLRIKLRRVDLARDAIDSELIVRPGVIEQAVAALNAGKHIIFIGPPGTGKTTLAEELCRHAHDLDCNRGHMLVTASADWTTFDTIGGYVPGASDRLVFRPGMFLEAIESHRWLIIDEINRADIDKAFGELFTVLSNQAVTLPYKEDSRLVRIIPPGRPTSHETRDFAIHPSWRIIGTMNVYDKAALFAMSYSLMRRFAFIDVGIPSPPDYRGLIRTFLRQDGLPTGGTIVIQMLYDLFDQHNPHNYLMRYRALGPAIARDLIRYLRSRTHGGQRAITHEHLSEALLLYVAPQFEGLERDQIRNIYDQIRYLFSGEALANERQALLGRIAEIFPSIHFEE
ncbi:MAG: molecular chaperone DnaK [Kouleothrix sp.]|nr:molecular chaperone DnaK [Kouleothrix sp.]